MQGAQRPRVGTTRGRRGNGAAAEELEERTAAAQEQQEQQTLDGAALREAFERLGPAFVKIGQALATR